MQEASLYKSPRVSRIFFSRFEIFGILRVFQPTCLNHSYWSALSLVGSNTTYQFSCFACHLLMRTDDVRILQ